MDVEKFDSDVSGPHSAEQDVIPDWLRPKPAVALKTQLPAEVIKGALYAGGKLMLAGGSKSYKTWIMLDLAYSIANGLPFLGMLTKKCKVFYADLELLEADKCSRSVIHFCFGNVYSLSSSRPILRSN
jgi:AAA domain